MKGCACLHRADTERQDIGVHSSTYRQLKRDKIKVGQDKGEYLSKARLRTDKTDVCSLLSIAS